MAREGGPGAPLTPELDAQKVERLRPDEASREPVGGRIER